MSRILWLSTLLLPLVSIQRDTVEAGSAFELRKETKELHEQDQDQREDRHRRQVWSWVSPAHFNNQNIVIRQLHDHPDLLDGIQVWCGCHFAADGLTVNETAMANCIPLMQAAHDTNTKFQLMIRGEVPALKFAKDASRTYVDAAIAPFVKDAISLYRRFPLINGFSIDDERDCAPRGSTEEFEEWVLFHNAFAEGLKAGGDLPLTTAVQALFGILDAPKTNNPCQHLPSQYPINRRVVESVRHAKIQKFAVMDTYYFSTGRFMNVLDWHLQYVPHRSLAIGLMNRDDLTEDDWIARFHALDKSIDEGGETVNWINVWVMPIDEALLPFLKRWKTRCAGCGAQSSLGCYDMTIACDEDDKREKVRTT